MSNNKWGAYVTQEDVEIQDSEWKFGLNQNVFLKDMEFHKKSKEEPEKGAKMVFIFGKDDSDSGKKLYVFEPADVYDREGNKIPKSSPDYEAAMDKKMRQTSRTLLSVLECFCPPNKIVDEMSKSDIESFTDLCGFVKAHIIENTNWKNIPLDIFMQWSKRMYNGKSFLEIPANTNQGLIVCAHKQGDWREDLKPGEHIKYYLYENDEKTDKIHPIMRGKFFMNSANSKKTEFPSADSPIVNDKAETDIANDWASILS